MFEEHKKTIIITAIITLLPMVAGIILWDKLPDVMASHFDFSGNANGYSSKAMMVFGMPLFLLTVDMFALFVTAHDPKKKNISGKNLTLVMWIVPVISVITCGSIYAESLGTGVNITKMIFVGIGLVFTIIGNYLPKVRQNYTIGIKLPWTLASEDNWNRTHRLAGKLWVAGGILIMLGSLISPSSGKLYGALFVIMMILICAVPTVYSFMLYRKNDNA